jgi:hypothetical protein
MPFSVKLLQQLDKLGPDLKPVMFELLAEIERGREEHVARQEFLGFVQKTDENFQRVWTAIGKLVEVQSRLETVVEELAQAQKRTEEAIQQLTRKIDDLSGQVGGLSNTVGYGLEDRSYPILKKILKRDFGIDIERLFRKNIVYAHNLFDEINIYGETVSNGEKTYVIGECKAQFGPKDVDKYVTLLKRVGKHLGGPIISLALAYHFHPEAEERLKAQGIRYYWSYELFGEESP